MDAGSVLGGKFRLISLLGHGGMGTVWRAEHLGLRAPIAIKLLGPAISPTPEAVARFHREAQSAANLRSPHVVQILDHGVDEATGTPFIAMELLEGESLAERLSRVGRLQTPDALRVLTHVARALTRAHEVPIVHRDLKPGNVFIVQNDDEETIKVLDFGLAKWSDATPSLDVATVTGTFVGTAYYMSPEQVTGEKADLRADLWALGVVLYECLTGRRPFEADNVVALALLISRGQFAPASSFVPVPKAVDAWFERAFAVDTARRFQSAREMVEELRRAFALSGSQSLTASESQQRAPVSLTPVLEPQATTVAIPPAQDPLERTVDAFNVDGTVAAEPDAAAAPAPAPAEPTSDAAVLASVPLALAPSASVNASSVEPLSRSIPSPLSRARAKRRIWALAAVGAACALVALFLLAKGSGDSVKPPASASPVVPVEAPSKVETPTIAEPTPLASSPPPSVEPAPSATPATDVIPVEPSAAKPEARTSAAVSASQPANRAAPAPRPKPRAPASASAAPPAPDVFRSRK